MIKYDKVSKIYEQSGNEKIILNSVSVEINQGEYIWVTGKSGSGKSTFLNMLSIIINLVQLMIQPL